MEFSEQEIADLKTYLKTSCGGKSLKDDLILWVSCQRLDPEVAKRVEAIFSRMGILEEKNTYRTEPIQKEKSPLTPPDPSHQQMKLW